MSTMAMRADAPPGHAGDEDEAQRASPERGEEPAATIADAVRQCRDLAREANADDFGLFFLAAQGEKRRLVPVFDSSFPAVLTLTKVLCARASCDLARELAESAMPVWWRQGGQVPFLTAAARGWAIELGHPMTDIAGIAFPVRVERGRIGAVVFHGNNILLDEMRLCEMHARCFALFAQVASMRAQDCARVQTISKREIECLRLTANGLTSEEIATTLGLSVHTANQYMTNTTHKLNAVNRIHAVAKALRSGLID